MSAVLRAAGPDFDVTRFCADTRLAPAAVYCRGEPVHPTTRPDGRRHDRSGLHIVVSEAGFDDLPTQAREATQFLLAHRDEVARLVAFPGVDGAVLDFGLARRDVAVQCDGLPPELVRLAGSLGLGIELSQYPVGEPPPRATLGRWFRRPLLVAGVLTIALTLWFWFVPTGTGEVRRSPDGRFVAHADNLSAGTVLGGRDRYADIRVIDEGTGREVWRVIRRNPSVPDYGSRAGRFITWADDSSSVSIPVGDGKTLTLVVP